MPSAVTPTDSGSDSDWHTRPIDRKKLGSIIFNDEKQRKILNSIVHPAVTRAIAWCVLKAWLRGEKVVVVDVPLLIEGGLWKWMGKVVVVYWYVGRSRSVARVASPLVRRQLAGTPTPTPHGPRQIYSR